MLTLLCTIDQAVAYWTPDAKGGTVERLHTLTARGWRPMDCDLLDGYCGQIEAWSLTAGELLGDRQIAIALRQDCPSCGARWSYRRKGDELIRSWALQLRETGCTCSACHAAWPPAEFHWLARLLGCEALP